MVKQIILPILGVIAFIVIVGLYFQKSEKVSFPSISGPTASSQASKKIVMISDRIIPVEVVSTPEQRAKGLSGRTSLDKNSGMLFVFDSQNVTPVFWMKDMTFSIDIIWINDGKIVKIDKKIPFPAPGTPDDKLKKYDAGQPIDYVLEVTAGYSDANSIRVGDSVNLSKI